MCSNFENAKETQEEAPISLEKLRRCKRCEKNSFVCLQKKDPFCQDCFYEYCTHKFRATIGKSKLVKPYDPVLICFTGGSSSVAMLDMVIDGMQNPDFRRKLLITPSLLYIREIPRQVDESSVREKEKKVFEMMRATKLRALVSSMEMVYASSRYNLLEENFEPPHCLSSRDKLMSRLDQISSLTAKEDFLRVIRQRLVQEIAIKEGVRHIFSGETCTRTAVLTLTDLAQGKGSQITSQQAFCDTRFSVQILRPMREFVEKEVSFWNLMRKNTYVHREKLTTKLKQNASIEKLSESYIYGLEKDFPSTVYTIFRTGNKLTKPKEDKTRCDFCQSAKDDIKICSAFNALQLSHKLSKNPSLEESEQLNPSLCYSCNTLISEMTEKEKVRKKLSEIDISEYLL